MKYFDKLKQDADYLHIDANLFFNEHDLSEGIFDTKIDIELVESEVTRIKNELDSILDRCKKWNEDSIECYCLEDE